MSIAPVEQQLEFLWASVESNGRKIDRVLLLLEALVATQAELAGQVQTINAKLQKIGTETGTLLTKIDELKAQIVTAGNVTPELQAAVDALSQQAGIVDDLVEDAVPPTP